MEKSGGGYGWFALGAILGASMAVLFAPKAGKDTRDLLGKKADEGREALTEGGQDLISKSKDLYERGRQLAEDAADLFERGRKLVRG